GVAHDRAQVDARDLIDSAPILLEHLGRTRDVSAGEAVDSWAAETSRPAEVSRNTVATKILAIVINRNYNNLHGHHL
ncbi:hypothetical protein, partial [Burkholderia pseudomallei]